MQSLGNYKFERLKKHAQFILLDQEGSLVDSCNSLFDTSLKSQEVNKWMPLFESIESQILLLELDSPELFLPKIQAPMQELRGFYDFSFSKIEYNEKQLILWIIYDNTKIYKDFFSYQQNRNELVLKNQRIGVIQSVLQSKRQELNQQIQRLNRFGTIKRNYYELISNNGHDYNGNGENHTAVNETSSYIAEVENTIGHLQDLVEELVILTNVKDISKFERKEFQVCNLLNQIVQNFPRENNIDLNLFVHSEIPEEIVGNYIYLKQIILALMKESVKYEGSENASIEIHFKPLELEGINESFLVEFKFSANQQEGATLPMVNYFAGNGIKQNSLLNYGSELELKLSIIQKFAASHNGVFNCESNEDCDLFVAFSFPYKS